MRSIVQTQPQPRLKLEELALLDRLDPDPASSAGTAIKLVRPGR